VRAIRKGYIKLNEEPKKEQKFYLMWNEDDKLIGAAGPKRDVLPAPKMPLPSLFLLAFAHFLSFVVLILSGLFFPKAHSESYNPPGEYLLNDDELKRYQLLDPEDRPMNYIPKK
jgi:ribosome biogenesis protein ERB1